MAAVHAVLFGHNRPEMVRVEDIGRLNQIRASQNRECEWKHPFPEDKRLSDF